MPSSPQQRDALRDKQRVISITPISDPKEIVRQVLAHLSPGKQEHTIWWPPQTPAIEAERTQKA